MGDDAARKAARRFRFERIKRQLPGGKSGKTKN
jgi:hypothetical protein